MILKEIWITYNRNGEITRQTRSVNSDILSLEDRDIVDLVSFSLFDKTIYNDIISEEKGVPSIQLHFDVDGVELFVMREPEYTNVTNFGNKVLNKALYSLKDKDEYPSLTKERYLNLISKHLNISYEEYKNNYQK